MSQADSRLEGQNLDSLLKNKMPAVGIDLGGTKLSAAAVADYRVITEPKTVPTPKGPENIIQAILDLIAHFQKDHMVSGVGIATAGIVNVDTGDVIGSTGNLPGWAGTHIKKIIESKTMLPTCVENDANAFAYGEVMAQGLAEKRCVVGLTLGTGIGGGIILCGKVFHGAHWAAGEVGHMRIAFDNQRMCTCGLFDCWEAFGAGRGLVATGQDLLQGISPEQSDLAKVRHELTTRQITEAAAKGDMIAIKAVQRWHDHLAAGIVSLAHTLDPDCFIIGGGLSRVVDFELLRETVSDRTLSRVGEKLEIRQSELGVYAGIVGAAQQAVCTLIPAK